MEFLYAYLFENLSFNASLSDSPFLIPPLMNSQPFQCRLLFNSRNFGTLFSLYRTIAAIPFLIFILHPKGFTKFNSSGKNILVSFRTIPTIHNELSFVWKLNMWNPSKVSDATLIKILLMALCPNSFDKLLIF